MGFTGYPFTWTNGRNGGDNIQERLDHFVTTGEWLNIYPDVRVIHEPKYFSNHCPLVLDCHKGCITGMRPNYQTIKFEEAWTKGTECEKLVESTWVKGGERVGEYK